MSFGSFLKDVAIGTAKKVVQKSHLIVELKREYENLSDDELIVIVDSSESETMKRNIAASILTKHRGYDRALIQVMLNK